MTISANDMLSISRFLEAHRSDKMSMRTAFKLNKIATALEPDMKLFQEKYKNLVNEYADTEASDGMPEGTFRIKQDKLDEYTAAVEELFGVEIELPNIVLTIEELENFSVTIEEIRPLMVFIQD
jgi:hypothetical protein